MANITTREERCRKMKNISEEKIGQYWPQEIRKIGEEQIF